MMTDPIHVLLIMTIAIVVSNLVLYYYRTKSSISKHKQATRKLMQTYKEGLPDDWNVFVDNDNVIVVKPPVDSETPELHYLNEALYASIALTPMTQGGTFHVTLKDIESLESQAQIAGKYGLMLLPTEDPNCFQILPMDKA